MNIKTILSGLLLFLTLTAFQCQKESESCHHSVTIRNNSDSTVIFALCFYKDNKCLLAGHQLLPGMKDELRLRYCWEDELINGHKLKDVFLVAPSQFNAPHDYYSCDSIEEYNKILWHKSLSLDELKAMDFTINYP